MSGPRFDDDLDYWVDNPDEREGPCECELDWSCPIHRHLPTPEDRIATEWSRNHP